MKSLVTISMLLSLTCGGCWGSLVAQQPPSPGVVSISLEDAIKRAQSSSNAFAAAYTDALVAQSERAVARSALLPNVVYHNQYLYTQGTGAQNGFRFIANNAVHEYVSQGSVTETIGGAALADYRRTTAEAAAARARLEVARRGLLVTVVGNYYGVYAADAKLAVAQKALDEAKHFGRITGERESNGEVAHADSVRSDLQIQQRQRDLNDATLAAHRARLDLAVLLFSDPTTPYTLSTSMHTLPALPQRSEIESAAMAHNPDLKAAMESLRSAQLSVTAARFGYLPELALNYSYGIDSAQFSVRAPDGSRNLGYSGSFTFDIPVWDWFATHSKVHESVARREQARIELTATQRRLVASLRETYQEAQVSLDQLHLLDTSVQSARESLRLTNLRYTSGEGNVLEIVDSENTLVQAESSRADGAARYFNALATLQTLTGTMPQ